MSKKWNWDRIVAIVSTAWNFVPSHIQDLILGYAWQTVAGLLVMIAYLGWAAFTSLPAIVNTALAFVLFVAGFVLVNQFRWARYLKRVRAQVHGSGSSLPSLPAATPSQLSHHHIRGVRLHISDMVRQGVYLRDRVFEDCQILGPALLFRIEGVTIGNCVFDGPTGKFSDHIWFVEEGRTLIGIIALERCSFLRCYFQNIALVASTVDAAELARGFGASPPSPVKA